MAQLNRTDKPLIVSLQKKAVIFVHLEAVNQEHVTFMPKLSQIHSYLTHLQRKIAILCALYWLGLYFEWHWYKSSVLCITEICDLDSTYIHTYTDLIKTSCRSYLFDGTPIKLLGWLLLTVVIEAVEDNKKSSIWSRPEHTLILDDFLRKSWNNFQNNFHFY